MSIKYLICLCLFAFSLSAEIKNVLTIKDSPYERYFKIHVKPNEPFRIRIPGENIKAQTWTYLQNITNGIIKATNLDDKRRGIFSPKGPEGKKNLRGDESDEVVEGTFDFDFVAVHESHSILFLNFEISLKENKGISQ